MSWSELNLIIISKLFVRELFYRYRRLARTLLTHMNDSLKFEYSSNAPSLGWWECRVVECIRIKKNSLEFTCLQVSPYPYAKRAVRNVSEPTSRTPTHTVRNGDSFASVEATAAALFAAESSFYAMNKTEHISSLKFPPAQDESVTVRTRIECSCIILLFESFSFLKSLSLKFFYFSENILGTIFWRVYNLSVKQKIKHYMRF